MAVQRNTFDQFQMELVQGEINELSMMFRNVIGLHSNKKNEVFTLFFVDKVIESNLVTNSLLLGSIK